MLPLNTLDDQMFEKIVENAKKMIPNLTDKWINYNLSDPGMTLIDLFAWLKEMQQYYLDQIGIKNKYKYLKLLGKDLVYDSPALSNITISNVNASNLLPSKCKFSANGVIFETLKEERLYPLKIEKFFTMSEGNMSENSDKNWKDSYFIFGEKPRVGNEFYICLNEPLPKNKIINIAIKIKNDYSIKRNKVSEPLVYQLANIKWEYYTINGWKEIKYLEDSTYNFITTGLISINIDEDMEKNNNLYIIKAILEQNNYEVSPILKYIDINTIDVIQKDTISEIIEFDGTDGDIHKYILPNYLGQVGDIEIYVNTENDLYERLSEYDICIENERKILLFNKLKHNKIPQKGKKNIKICCYDSDFSFKRKLDKCTGIPSYYINLNLNNIYYMDFEIIISKDLEECIWEKWNKIDDLYLANKRDKVYSLDLQNNTIIFGDGIHGKIPNGKVIVVGYSTTKANEGNIKKHEIQKCLWDIGTSEVINYDHAVGGKKAPSIEELFKEARADLNTITRAVTDEDYEFIVKSTPGLMIKNAKVIVPKEENSIFKNTNPNCVYVVAEAYGNDSKMGLNKAYITNIRNQIEKYRIITTEVEIISPEYIGIDIYGEIIVKPYYKDAKDIIRNCIINYFKNEEWTFGKGIVYSNLYGKIDILPCVNRIYSLTINFDGRGVKRDSSGDINVPENGMIYLKNCEVIVSDS